MNLFTKTWTNDFAWLELAIYSVLKNSKEPINWHVAVERLNRAALDEVIGRARAHFPSRKDDNFQTHDAEIVWPDCQNIVDGYMKQQWIKMNVHKLFKEHLVWNWDSDVIAKRPFGSLDFMRDGKPIWWWDDLNHLLMGGYPQERRASVESVFRDPVGREYMRCMPIPLLGKALTEAANTEYWKRSFDQCASGNRAFSEFNVIGEYCFRFFNSDFAWINAQNSGPTWQSEPNAITHQAWSWGGVNDGIRKMVLG